MQGVVRTEIGRSLRARTSLVSNLNWRDRPGQPFFSRIWLCSLLHRRRLQPSPHRDARRGDDAIEWSFSRTSTESLHRHSQESSLFRRRFRSRDARSTSQRNVSFSLWNQSLRRTSWRSFDELSSASAKPNSHWWLPTSEHRRF